VTSIIGPAYARYYKGIEATLPNGRVLAVGGSYFGIGNSICEIYDPDSETWELTDSLNIGRSGGVGMLLPPPWSEVLVAGGGKTCELYHPGAGTWTMTGPMNESRAVGAMALLPSGEVLITGGGGKTCELYNPTAKTWKMTDAMEFSREHHAVVILPTGKILAAGEYAALDPGPCEIYDPSDGAWETKPSLIWARGAHTVTPLPIIPTRNCSTNVLITGGEDSNGAIKYCELYNYSLEKVSRTGSLSERRTHHTAVLLPSGKVLVAGGKNTSAHKSCELYDVGAETWSNTENMSEARFDHTATLLKNGKVLVTGGKNGRFLNSCEVYNPGVSTWSGTDAMSTPKAYHTAVLLLDGKVLVIGGETSTGVTDSCEIWNGSNWLPANPLSTARCLHTATLLQSGKVLVMGGKDSGGNALASCEIYDPITSNWAAEADLNEARYLHNSTLLYSGLVLVTGGQRGTGYLSSCEIWDPAAELDGATNTHKWKTTAPLALARAYHSSVLIPDTMPFVLAIGGGGNINSVEQYDAGLGYRQIWQSEITNYPAVTHISPSMNIGGSLFRGVSEADGGNYCHIVSNDHPIISLVRVGGGNWQGNGGGEILHMPLSSSWDTAHTIVHPEITDFQGYYRLWSIVNGIPCKWYKECPPYGAEEKTGIRQKAEGISVSVYPNPATTKTSIKFRVQSSELKDSRLTIHNLSGRLIRSLPITDNRTPNTEVTWDGRDNRGKKVNSGIYFYSIKHEISEDRGKFVILK
jgi:N-acetylneuraminic acid mutarotase